MSSRLVRAGALRCWHVLCRTLERPHAVSSWEVRVFALPLVAANLEASLSGMRSGLHITDAPHVPGPPLQLLRRRIWGAYRVLRGRPLPRWLGRACAVPVRVILFDTSDPVSLPSIFLLPFRYQRLRGAPLSPRFILPCGIELSYRVPCWQVRLVATTQRRILQRLVPLLRPRQR